jgi:signal transduction histidine kinase
MIKSTIENISDIINQSLNELRQLSKNLTDNNIESSTLNQLLEIECNKFNDLKKCKITFSGDLINSVLAYQSKSVLLRISQEFIQNSIKHSKCKNIYVSLNQTNKKIKLNLQDDGKGFDVKTNNSNGMGLSNIKSRIKLIGGTYFLESKINSGTKLTLEIPL